MNKRNNFLLHLVSSFVLLVASLFLDVEDNVKARRKEISKEKNFIYELSSTLSKERVKRAKKEAEEEIFQIQLSELRTKMGLRQEDVKTFTQYTKLEKRKDLKISTLVECLDGVGMGVEVKALKEKE